MNQPETQEAAKRVSELRRGDKIAASTFLVETANFKQTRNQKYFIQMVVRDASGSVRALRWEATEELFHSFQVGDYLEIDGRVEEFQGNLQIIIDRLERRDPDSVDHSRFLPVSERPIEEMESELHAAIEEIGNEPLRELLFAIVKDPEIRPRLCRCPAGKTLHHAWVGGLLEHILSLIGAARNVCQHYRQLNRDLLFAASILHDLGKVEELSFSSAFTYTDRGQLLGHIGTGLIILDRFARAQKDFPEGLLLELQHLVASHHGIPEYGALKLPMTAEAMVFHYLDNMDAKLSTFETIEGELPPSSTGENGRWSDYKHHLSRKVFFPNREED